MEVQAGKVGSGPEAGQAGQTYSQANYHWYLAASSTDSYCCAALPQLRSWSIPRSCTSLQHSMAQHSMAKHDTAQQGDQVRHASSGARAILALKEVRRLSWH